MKIHVFALFAALAAVTPLLVGCGEDDYDREAAYPQTIGYTAPSARPAPNAQVAPEAQQIPAPPPAPPPPPGPDIADDGAYAGGDDYADTDPSALTDFRSTLDPYGTWADDPTYGSVWVPSESVVGEDFSPYTTAGHWTYDDDYTWVSDYDWGWAPFHYGRWAYSPPYGWEWIPGRTYAGAWVSWRYGWGDWGYVGWAPLGPTWGWRGGRAVGLGFVPSAPYGFCATGDLFAGRVAPHMITGAQAAEVGAHTQPWLPANPTVNGRVTATPRVNGPPPQILHISASAVARASSVDRGILQARAFAHAGTASALGAREPQVYASRGLSTGRMPAYGAPAPSHFGGRLGFGFRGDIASARPTYSGQYNHGPTFRGGYSGYSGGYSGPSVHRSPGVHPGSSGHSGSQSSGEGEYFGGPHGVVAGGGYHGGFGSGAFRGGTGGTAGAGGFSGAGGYSGGFGGGGRGGGGGGGRGGGGHR